jgi:hypothetical protein
MLTTRQPGAAESSEMGPTRPGDAHPANAISSPAVASQRELHRGRTNPPAVSIGPGTVLDSRDDILFWLCATDAQPRT